MEEIVGESIIHLFKRNVNRKPEKCALICNNKKVSWEELDNYVERITASNSDLSNKKVGLLMSPGITYVASFLALTYLDATIIPISYHWRSDMIENMSMFTGMEAILFDDVMREKYRNIDYPRCQKIVQDFDGIKRAEVDNKTRKMERKVDDYLLLSTSGSTMDPKVVVLSELQMLSRVHYELTTLQLNEEDRVVISTPIYHSLATHLLLSGLCGGMQIVILKGFSWKGYINAISKYKITYSMTVPAQLLQIPHSKEVRDSIKSLRCLVSTSSQLPMAVKRNISSLLPQECSFYNLLASTETEFISFSDNKRSEENDVIGISTPGCEIKIISNGKEINNNNVGEIVCKGPMVFSRYYRDPTLTNSSFWHGYYKTGDLGYFDDNYVLHYVGRKKEIIISGGVNIYPKDIESVINQIDGVRESKVISLQDDVLGETIGLIVESDVVDEKRIRLQCRDKLSDFQQPRKIRITKKIIKNPMGKMSLDVLRSYFDGE